MFEDSTTEFTFCLYDKLHSTQNCTNGSFSSLPLLCRQELSSRILNNGTDIKDTDGNTSDELEYIKPAVIILVTLMLLFVAAVTIVTFL